MRRRQFLRSGAALAATGPSLAAPAFAQGRRQLKLVTDWPESMPGLQTSAVRLARTIGETTAGRITIEVFAAGALVRPLETFDAVGAGVADMYHSYDGYFEKRSLACNFYSGIPFGFTADELFAWVQYGGGQTLWDELYARFNIKPLQCCSTGTQMGGWFNKEIAAPEDLRGLRYRMPGLGGEILRRLGANVVSLAGGDIAQSLRSGAIAASEWIGPWLDMHIGLHQAAGYYYYPGFHEPGTIQTLGINRALWDSLDASDQRLFEAVAAGEYARSLAEFNANNALWLRRLRDEGSVKIQKFDDSLLRAFLAIGKDVVAEAGAGDALSRRIYDSYQQFRSSIIGWSDIADRAMLNARRLG